MGRLRELRKGEWVFKEIKPKKWKIYLEYRHLTLLGAGSPVTVDLPLSAFHTLNRFEFTQNTSANVADATAFDISIIKQLNSDPELSESRSTLWSKTGLALSDYGINWTKENFEREPTTYTLSITGANTNRMVPILYVEGDF